VLIVNGEGEGVTLSDILSLEHELTQDFLSIVEIFSARLNGLRSYKQETARSTSSSGTLFG